LTLKERIVVFDGAMGTNLQVGNLTLDDFGGLRFEAATTAHHAARRGRKCSHRFLDVGCDVIGASSFSGTTMTLPSTTWPIRRMTNVDCHVGKTLL
jgi:5-methyltetrahydrofolate--homocysteine methyltransferase